MSNHLIDGNTKATDVRDQRIAGGTVGGDHFVPASINALTLNAIVDDQDSRITYGNVAPLNTNPTITTTLSRATLFDIQNTATHLGQGSSGYGQGAVFHFTGSAIGILGRLSPSSGSVRVFIDGKETAGRTSTWAQLNFSTYGTSPLNATDTTIRVDSADTYLASSGAVMIDDEIIIYTGISGTGTSAALTGCTRGATTNGISQSVASTHTATAIVYAWASRIPLNFASTVDYSFRKLLWYNALLPAGPHKIVFACTDDNGLTGIYDVMFDGFLLGKVIGSSALSLEYGTAELTATTDAAGTANLGLGFSTRTGVAYLSILGYHQLLPATGPGSSVTMAKVGIQGDGFNPNFYLCNGPASTTISMQLWFCWLTEGT